MQEGERFASMERYIEGYFGLSCVKELGEGRRTGRKSQVKSKCKKKFSYVYTYTLMENYEFICIYAKLCIYARVQNINKLKFYFY